MSGMAIADAVSGTAGPATASVTDAVEPPCPKALTMKLRYWIERLDRPYPTLKEKKVVAGALGIDVVQVTNFCNNYRKRFSKVGKTVTSYCQLFSMEHKLAQIYYTHVKEIQASREEIQASTDAYDQAAKIADKFLNDLYKETHDEELFGLPLFGENVDDYWSCKSAALEL